MLAALAPPRYTRQHLKSSQILCDPLHVVLDIESDDTATMFLNSGDFNHTRGHL